MLGQKRGRFGHFFLLERILKLTTKMFFLFRTFPRGVLFETRVFLLCFNPTAGRFRIRGVPGGERRRHQGLVGALRRAAGHHVSFGVLKVADLKMVCSLRCVFFLGVHFENCELCGQVYNIL